MATPSISEEILAFGALNEQEIKQRLIAEMIDYYETTTCELYVEKFRRGAQEHGDITGELLIAQDWRAALHDEFKDAFWYMTIRMFVERSLSRLAHAIEEVQ